MTRVAAFFVGIAVAIMALWPALVGAAEGTSGYATRDRSTILASPCGPFGCIFDNQDPPHYIVVGTQTYTQTGHSTITLTDMDDGILYAGTNITLGVTSTATGSATGTGTVACVSNCTGTPTDTGTGTNTATAAGGNLTYTWSSTATACSPSAQSATATVSATGTSTVSKLNTYTITGTGTGTASSTNGGTSSITGTTTGDQTGCGTSTGTGTGTQITTFQFAKTWTGSGTWTRTDTLAGSVTLTYTITGTGTTTASITTTETGTGSASWNGTLTSTTTGTSYPVSSNPIIGAVLTGTITATGVDTYTIVLPNRTNTWAGTLTITQTDIATVTSEDRAGKIPMAGTDGKISTEWLPDSTGATTLAWSSENLSSSYISLTASSWTDVMTKTLSVASVGGLGWANATLYCTVASRNIMLRLAVDGGAVGPQPQVDMAMTASMTHMSVSGAWSFAPGSHTLKLQAYANGNNCRIYGGNTNTGMTVQQF